MDMIVPKGAKIIIERLEAAGHSAFLVGGCVRDALRGASPSDYDIASSALPDEVILALPGCDIIPTGAKYGTVTVVVGGEAYEVTTFRIDGPYSASRRPDRVTSTDNLICDLSRRDFTINAMAYHPVHGLNDPFGGAGDLRHGLVRCVGDAGLRFGEDALRILRAARFASVLDFELDPATHEAMELLAHSLKGVSAERIFAELCRALTGPGFGRVFASCPSVMRTIIPEMAPCIGFAQNTPYHAYDVYAHILHAVDACPPDLTIRMAMLLHDVAKPTTHTTDDMRIDHFKGHAAAGEAMSRDILTRLKCDNKLKSHVCELVLCHGDELALSERVMRRRLRRLGEEQLRRLIAVKAADNAAKSAHIREARSALPAQMLALLDKVLTEEQVFSLRQLALSGGDVLALGVPPGPEVGLVLNTLLSKVIEDELPNNRAELLLAAKKMIKKTN